MTRNEKIAILKDIVDGEIINPSVRKEVGNWAIESLEQTRWIPVNEKLPENCNQEVLISLEWGIDIGEYRDGEWHSEWINHYDDGDVLAWMPLPKRYEPQERSNKE